MTFEATAAVLYEPGGSFQLKTVTLDDLRADELLIRVQASGICHTDIAAQGLLTMPAVLGHEGMGIVEQIGSGVDGIKAGDRVVISYGFCNSCPGCQEGKPFICDNSVPTNFGGTRIDGSHTTKLDGTEITASFFQQSSFASHSITSARNVVRVENEMEPQLLAPLGCGIMTGAGSIVNTFKVGAKDSLLVFGAGTVSTELALDRNHTPPLLEKITALSKQGILPLIRIPERGLHLPDELQELRRVAGHLHQTAQKEKLNLKWLYPAGSWISPLDASCYTDPPKTAKLAQRPVYQSTLGKTASEGFAALRRKLRIKNVSDSYESAGL